MAAPRSTSLRALRLLSQQNSSAPASTLASMAPFRRFLHITGAYSAQPASGPDVTSIYRARSVADLRAECERRNLRAGGSKAEKPRSRNGRHLGFSSYAGSSRCVCPLRSSGRQRTLPMKPQIYSIGGASSDGSEPSPMAEVVDNYALEINPYNLTETVNRSRLAASSLDAAKSQESAIGVKGMIKGLWNAMLDDALGPKQNSNTQSR
ncbi:hypothetical protein CISG_02985 [Coccidioides immitis RMSCC 3703]|uniref:SAP domain-containing protein n=1 Tax=Coccidioides immitis RMSCC 3703 TaxID=454286 RepID=A0A0J8TFD2_COCIT|nr:hypothetical protein CISG_02985 [Coccidioides immitis RMSCC 3703]